MLDWFKRLAIDSINDIKQAQRDRELQREYKTIDSLPKDVIALYKEKANDFNAKMYWEDFGDTRVRVACNFPGPYYMCYYERLENNRFFLKYQFSYCKDNLLSARKRLFNHGVVSRIYEVSLSSEIPFHGNDLDKPTSFLPINW